MTRAATFPSLREVVALAFRRQRLILSALLLPPFLAVLALLMMPTEYEARAKLLIGASSVANNSAPDPVAAEVEVLGSRDLLAAVLETVGLAKAYPKIAAKATEEAAVDQFRKDLSLDPDAGAQSIEIAYGNPSRAVAEDVLKNLVAAYIERHQRAFQASDVTLIEQQIRNTDDKLAALTISRESYLDKTNTMAGAAPRAALLKERETANAELDDAQRRRAELISQIDFLKSAARTQPALTERGSATHPSQSAEALKQHLAELREKEAKYEAIYKPGMPLVAANKREIAATETALQKMGGSETLPQIGPNPVRDQINATLVTAQASLPPLDARIGVLRNEVEHIGAKLRNFKGQVTLDDLDGQISTVQGESRLLHDALVKAKVNEDLSLAGASNVSVIEKPNASTLPRYPNRLAWMLTSLLLGLAAGALALWSAISSRASFITVDAIERVLGLPVLAAVPEIPLLDAPISGRSIGHAKHLDYKPQPKKLQSGTAG